MRSFVNFFLERYSEILQQSLQHLYLTSVALFFAILVGVLVGIILSRFPKISTLIISFLGAIQTIPSLALLGFMLPFLGIGALPAIVALFLYALLPIVRNTYIGIQSIEGSVKESAVGIGMTDYQILTQIEIPIALPIIFAGIRTATVINIGVATLCALIGAGGLGEFIFRGISLNNPQMILAGAIPSALLALGLDFGLGWIEKKMEYFRRYGMYVFGGLGIVLIGSVFLYLFNNQASNKIKAGFDAEFMERADGLPGLAKHYNFQFPMESIEMDAGLMYQALANEKVDLIGGYSTDGRIKAYDLVVLEDDKNYFPPYQVIPLLNAKTMQKYPYLKEILEKLAGKIADQKMQTLNYEVDSLKKQPKEVAQAFVKSLGYKYKEYYTADNQIDIIIGGKKFTEQYILCEIFKIMIENYSSLKVKIKGGLGGSQIVFGAIKTQEIDIYPEYTGTAFLVLLDTQNQTVKQEKMQPQQMYNFVKESLKSHHQIETLAPLGFNNTYALMVKRSFAQKHQLKKISDLANFKF
jgi:osmoprotectant transport system permease protein